MSIQFRPGSYVPDFHGFLSSRRERGQEWRRRRVTKHTRIFCEGIAEDASRTKIAVLPTLIKGVIFSE